MERMTTKKFNHAQFLFENGMYSNEADELFEALKAERAEVERLKQDRDDWHSVVKDICEEWNEDCDPDCNSYGHTEACKATSIAQAKRELNERAEKAEAEVERLRNELQAMKCPNADCVGGGKEVAFMGEGIGYQVGPCPLCTTNAKTEVIKRAGN